MQGALTQALRASDSVGVFEQRFLVDLLTSGERCVGALVLDAETGEREVFWADAVVLATGGAGQVFRVTTNPLIATGDGLAAAWRAGAEVADLEFVQFHPTALDHEAAPRFLITEALRGEGAYLLDCDEERFMIGVHPLAELAPRDVVSREIEHVMQRCGRNNVWLDARHLGEEYLRARFPTIWEACSEAGYDLSRDLLPGRAGRALHRRRRPRRHRRPHERARPLRVRRGHRERASRRQPPRLELAARGLVFSRRIVRALDADTETAEAPERIVAENPSRGRGAARNRRGASHAQGHDAAIGWHEPYRRGPSRGGARDRTARRAWSMPSPPHQAELELANLVTVGTLITHAAWLRTESRGCHSRIDFPERDDEHWRVRTVFRRGFAPRRKPITGVSFAPAGSRSAKDE